MSNQAFRDRNLSQALQLMLVLVVGLLTTVVTAQPIREYPPSLPPRFRDMPLNGGRVQSITVSPTDSRRIIAAHQWGGLWQTVNGGDTWNHLSALQAVFVVDVAYAPDGRTIIATVARDLRSINGGGIWVSRDEGATWDRPVNGSVPTTVGGLMRTSAYGISYAPDNRNRIYVATDYGIATSTDNGASWSHQLLEPAGPGARSVQGLPGNRAIAVTPGAIYLKNAAGDIWETIRRGRFSDGFKNIDVSPYDNDKVFILQDYNTLLLHEVAVGSWTPIPLPGGGGRGPFVRASRGNTGFQAVDLWVGLGVNLYKTSCADMACIRRLRCVRRPDLPADPCDWRALGRGEGLHDDTGYLGLDAQKRLVMYGSDGGLFKPQNPEGTNWTLGSPGGSGMNSYQITSLAGTNYSSSANPVPSLYFGTQDNALWASPDGGRTWPNFDCAEGWLIQAWHQATSPSSPAARVAYTVTGCSGSLQMSDANLLNQRATPNIDRAGRRIIGTPWEPFLLSQGNWIRFVDGRYYFLNRQLGSWLLHVSTDNLERWQQVGTTLLNPAARWVFKSGGPSSSDPTTYTAFAGAQLDANGNPRIALARMQDVLRVSPGEIDELDLLYLPGPNGSLGVRATEFDWHAVFGVDPRDPSFLIAPDVANSTVWKSTRSGASWTPDDQLTSLVTQGGRLLFYEGNPGQVQVTNIAFSPYERNLIMVGTREAGVIYSEDHGNTWQTIPDSEAMLYVTGFFFGRDGTVYVSTYGRGLWKIDMRRRARLFHDFPFCVFRPSECILRLPVDPRQNVIRDFPWKDYDVLVVFGGRVNGLIRSEEAVKAINITPGSSYRFYAADKQAMPEITESKEGAGFRGDATAEFALKNQEVITGVVFKDGQVVGYLTNKEEFKADQEPVAPKAGKEVPADKPGSGLPYLSISTDSSLGPGLVQAGGVVRLFAIGFMPGIPAEVRLDGKTLAKVNLKKDGRLSYKLSVGEELSMGQHRLKVVQKTQQGERKAVATFVKVRGPDRFAQRR